MLDPSSFGLALGSLKNIVDLLRNANDAQLAIKVTSEVANLQGQLLDVQQQSLAIQQENQQLRSELDRLKAFSHHHSVMWRVLADGTEDGPLCPSCNGEGRDMRLQLVQQATTGRDFLLLFCPRKHVEKETHQSGFSAGVRQEPTYRVPKELIRDDYFFNAAPKQGQTSGGVA